VVLLAWFAVLTLVWTGIGLLLTGPDSGLVRSDEDMSQWLADRRTPTLDDLTLVGSMLADTIVKIAVTAVVSVIMLVVWRSWREPLMMVLALVLEASSFIVVTTIVGRPRPDVPRLEGSPVDSSFPSGHTAAAAAYGAIVVVASWRTERRWVPRFAAVVVATVVVAVGCSRAYRGMHHVSDVLAGAVLGVVAVVAVWLLLRDRAPSPSASPSSPSPSSPPPAGPGPDP